MLGVKSSSGLGLYDWESLELIRRIDIQPKHVFWSENGELVCLATEEGYFILKYNQNAVVKARQDKQSITEDGIEDSFEVSRKHSYANLINFFKKNYKFCFSSPGTGGSSRNCQNGTLGR